MRRPRAIRAADGTLVRVIPSAIRLDPPTFEVLGWVGFALVWAQALERTLAAWLSFASPESLTATPAQFRLFALSTEQMTAGQLISSLSRCDLSDADKALLSTLKSVVRRRDRLAHHFLRRPSGRWQLGNNAGRAKVTNEARSDADDFRIYTNRIALRAFEYALSLHGRTSLLNEHVDWLEATRADLETRGGMNHAFIEIATEIGELMEAIEHPI